MGIKVEDLNTLKVAEIKEYLKKMDLATTGFKKELVDRLKEAMEARGLAELAEEEVKVEEPKAEEAKVEEATVAEPKEEEEAKEDVQIPENPKVTLTLDEIKDKVIEHIKVSITRAKKFQEDDKIKRLTKDLHRIEKFGIAETNPIAIELGLVEPEKKPVRNNKKNGGKAKNNRRRYHPYKR
jgi:hypothetical protein